MKLTVRAAITAAVTFCAGAVVAATTPGFAVETPDLPVEETNTADPELVPPPVADTPLPAIGEAALLDDSAELAAAGESGELAFASLSDAVDAQDIGSDVDRELECLAIGVYYESKGEPLAGQLAVAQVILNRVNSGRYPGSTCGVLTQHRQFSFVRGGRLPTPPNDAAWRRALRVAQVAQRNLWEGPVPRAMFFHANYVSPNWRRTRVATIGNHIFYR